MGIIEKALVFNRQVQVICIQSADIVNKAIEIHELSPVCAATLGRTLSLTAMMASNLKGEKHSLSITIKGDGPIGSIVTACDSALNLRGYVDYPNIDLPLKQNGKLDVSSAVGQNGNITVIKDLGLKEAYIGKSEIISGEIAEDFANYFAVSEQQPCAVALGVLIDRDYSCISAGGLILNILPNCADEVIDAVEKLAGKLGDISNQINGKTAKQYISEVFSGQDIEFSGTQQVHYSCKCNSTNIDRVIIALTKAEADDIIQEQGKISIKCHFCNKEYIYYQSDVNKLFSQEAVSGTKQ